MTSWVEPKGAVKHRFQGGLCPRKMHICGPKEVCGWAWPGRGVIVPGVLCCPLSLFAALGSVCCAWFSWCYSMLPVVLPRPCTARCCLLRSVFLVLLSVACCAPSSWYCSVLPVLLLLAGTARCCLLRSVALILLDVACCARSSSRLVVAPNGACTGLDIGFSNMSLVFISISFYTMCKATVPLFLLAFAFIWGIERCEECCVGCGCMNGVVGLVVTGLSVLSACKVSRTRALLLHACACSSYTCTCLRQPLTPCPLCRPLPAARHTFPTGRKGRLVRPKLPGLINFLHQALHSTEVHTLHAHSHAPPLYRPCAAPQAHLAIRAGCAHHHDRLSAAGIRRGAL